MTQHVQAQENRGGERVHVGAFIDPQQRDQLVALARKSDRSFSSLVRRALAAELERETASPQ